MHCTRTSHADVHFASQCCCCRGQPCTCLWLTACFSKRDHQSVGMGIFVPQDASQCNKIPCSPGCCSFGEEMNSDTMVMTLNQAPPVIPVRSHRVIKLSEQPVCFRLTVDKRPVVAPCCHSACWSQDSVCFSIESWQLKPGQHTMNLQKKLTAHTGYHRIC